jgi:phosphohistidine phosphatase
VRIVLLRHAIAEENSPSGDAARELTAEGRKKAEGVCRAIAGMELGIGHILTSPLVRARQTAVILKEALKFSGPLEECRALVPEGRPADVTDTIAAAKVDCVALVGHEPMLSQYTAWFAGGGRFDVRKSGVVILEGNGLPGPDGGVVVAMFAPRHMRAVR